MSHQKAPSILTAEETARGYDWIAREYASRMYRELESKPFDCEFLDRFALAVQGGEVLDVGCGPGHIGKYLSDRGITVRGLDISEEMVRIARELNPEIDVLQGDMRDLRFPGAFFSGVVAFYSIIHLEPAELESLFLGVRRVLKPGGILALAFHVGSEILHVDELWGIRTNLDFVLLQPSHVADALGAAGFGMVECAQRPPYDPPIEAQTHRCYILAQCPGILPAAGINAAQ